MDPERWRRITAVFHAALERPPEARAGFLDGACDHEPEVRAAVDRLLAAHERMGAFGEQPLVLGPDGTEDSRGGDPPAADPLPTAAGASTAHARSSWFAWLAGAVVLLTLGVFGYAAVRLVASGGHVPEFGWEEVLRDGRWLVEAVDPVGPAAAHLRPGDRIAGVDGGPMFGPLGTIPWRRALRAGTTYDLAIERDGVRREVTLPVVPGPERLAPRAALFLVCLVWCGVGLFIGLARPDRAVARLAGAASWTTGVGFLHAGLLSGGPLFHPLHVILGYHFFCRFPADRPTTGARRWSLVVLYGLAATPILLGLWLRVTMDTGGVAAAARLVDGAPWILGLRGALVPPLYYAALGLTVMVAAVDYRGLRNGDQRRRVRWLVLGAIAGLAPQVAWSVSQIVFGPEAVAWLETPANLFTVLIPLSAAYAVVRHRVFDIRVVVRRSLQYLLARRTLQAAVALPFVALLHTLVRHRDLTLTELVGETRGYLVWLVLAVVVLKVRTPLRRWLDRRFFREEYDRERLLLRILEDVARADSIPDLTHLVHEQLASAFHPSVAYVWYRDPDEQASASARHPALSPPDVPGEGRWVGWLERAGRATSLPTPAEAEPADGEARWFHERGLALAVPLMDPAERLVGAMLLGEKRSEEPYDARDLSLLNAMARQAAVARENLRLRSRVGEEVRVRREVLARIGHDADLLKECPRCGACFDGAVDRCPADGAEVGLSLPAPRTVGGRYRLDRRLGTGGMGAVFEAHDLRLERTVAVKVLLGRAFGRRAALRRFHREARAAARLSHPNIVSVHDYGSLEGDGAFLVMERVRGVTLRERLAGAPAMATSEAADWFDPVLAALGAAHEAGIVHRDVKPENVMGRCDPPTVGSVKLLDLGLARFHEADLGPEGTGTLTSAGVVVGTLAYMAPEQMAGRRVDPRTDVFSVGVMLVEALTGRAPLSALNAARPASLARWSQHLRGPSSALRALEDVVRRCVANDPDERFHSAEALRAALIPALRDCPPLEPVPDPQPANGPPASTTGRHA